MIEDWLIKAFEVKNIKNNEANFPCPKCSHESFYFNINKKIGFCHRASCHSKITLKQLISHVGYPPESSPYGPRIVQNGRSTSDLTLPSCALKITDPETIEALGKRGVSKADIGRFDIRASKSYIYVPVFFEGKLVQFVSRRINRIGKDWFKDIPKGVLRYKYAKAEKISNFIFGWGECKFWEQLVLVENTFVSIWLRDLGVTTNFGSNLSDKQIDLIVHSNIKQVIFLWDEGADSQKAIKKLKAVGVPSKAINIKGQPDDYTKEQINEQLYLS